MARRRDAADHPWVFDSHCHLHDARVVDAAAQIERARAAGVRGFLLAGVEPEGWLAEEALARAHAGIALSYGVHPQLVAERTDGECDAMVAALEAALDDRGRFAPSAIGEIGLDAAGARRASLERQERIFRAQLATARARDLPIVLHILRTHGEALRVLRGDGIPRAGGVVHSYSGSPELVRDYLALGLHLSFAGPVTWTNARRAAESVRATPRERLLVETDAPDQTPEAHRPGANEPAFLVDVVAAVALLRGEPFDAVAAATERNARALFRLTEPT